MAYRSQHSLKCCVSSQTIDNMQQQGAPSDLIEFAKNTQNSMDANNVARHRDLIKQYNPSDPWKTSNDFVMHPANYRFGQTGNTSPEYIARMLGTLNQPVQIYGPPINLPLVMLPHIVFIPR